ncbi:MAG: ribonuclease [Candidatus Peribacteria bacterium]|nr:ribonuclease [Candidatus Peribacteria bacterium]
MIAGIDEVGRGALAGPVVAGAVILHQPLFRRRRKLPHWSPFRRPKANDYLIADSKILSPGQRSFTYEWIIAYCSYGIGIVEAELIDSMGIVRANELAMRRALDMLTEKTCPDHLLVDGRDPYSFSVPHTSLIGGDRKEPCIAAASILAKVTRDRMMVVYHQQYPLYEFHTHKGYGSTVHRQNIAAHGPCSLHRRTFLKNIFAASSHTYEMAS